MSKTRGPHFNEVERMALAAATAAGVTVPSQISRQYQPEQLALLVEVLEARLGDVESRFEARLMALEEAIPRADQLL